MVVDLECVIAFVRIEFIELLLRDDATRPDDDGGAFGEIGGGEDGGVAEIVEFVRQGEGRMEPGEIRLQIYLGHGLEALQERRRRRGGARWGQG